MGETLRPVGVMVLEVLKEAIQETAGTSDLGLRREVKGGQEV